MSDHFGEYESLCEVTVPTKDALVMIVPVWEGYVYARRTIESFFKYTPADQNPVALVLDDCSPSFKDQNWDYFYQGPPGGFPLPRDRICHRHYQQNRGLTRSWNAGLFLAKTMQAQYAIAGNADVILTPGWERALIHQLKNGIRLVGPVTNAPGLTNRQRQNVRNFYQDYKVSDDKADLHAVADKLWQQHGPTTIREMLINGFFTMSTVDYWWEGKHSKDHVFDPSKVMKGNEDELEVRWKRHKWRIGFAPGSFVFHYRAVSRGKKFLHTGWTRTDDPHKEI